MEQRDSAHSHGFDSNNAKTGDQMQLPPGFRFHPTDEELITHYLSLKLLDASFNAQAIGEADLNSCEPWQLPRKSNRIGEELYIFCVRDRKYPTGLRLNRATNAGYWKATGKDREIYRVKLLVGMKKTLVFYRGRAPSGEKTNWVMHEYRMEGKSAINILHRASKSDWVLCRIFKKGSAGNGKKAFRMSKMGSLSYEEEQPGSPPPPPLPTLPPLMDFRAHVTCFSNAKEGRKAQDPELFFSKFMPASSSLYGGSFMGLLDGVGFAPKQESEKEMLSISQETGLTTDMNPEISSGSKTGCNSLEQSLWIF